MSRCGFIFMLLEIWYFECEDSYYSFFMDNIEPVSFQKSFWLFPHSYIFSFGKDDESNVRSAPLCSPYPLATTFHLFITLWRILNNFFMYTFLQLISSGAVKIKIEILFYFYCFGWYHIHLSVFQFIIYSFQASLKSHQLHTAK